MAVTLIVGPLDNKNLSKQEWSSLESSLYENWDEIEMLFGHLVMANLQLVIGNKQLVIGRRQWKKDNW